MFTFDEIGNMLDEIMAEFPQELFAELNGGVNLLPSLKMNEDAGVDDLYVMGEYCHDAMGRYINLYYGSISTVCGSYAPSHLRERLRRLVSHELTHHIESLAGERTLEIKDEEQIERFREQSRGEW